VPRSADRGPARRCRDLPLPIAAGDRQQRAAQARARAVDRCASDERYYFWCPVSSAELTRDNLTPYERTYIQESRWWALDDPDLRRIRVFPEDFVDAASSVLRRGRPAAAQLLQ
jgi:hypothetical protein